MLTLSEAFLSSRETIPHPDYPGYYLRTSVKTVMTLLDLTEKQAEDLMLLPGLYETFQRMGASTEEYVHDILLTAIRSLLGGNRCLLLAGQPGVYQDEGLTKPYRYTYIELPDATRVTVARDHQARVYVLGTPEEFV